MKKIKFPYGQEGMVFESQEDIEVFQPDCRSPLQDAYTSIIKNLLRPLGYHRTLFDMAKECKTACIVVDAYYPPDVNHKILKPLLKTLHASGMTPENITLLLASEYPSEFSEEIARQMFANKTFTDYSIYSHRVAAYTQHELLGKTSRGTPVYLDKRLNEAEIKIMVGGINAHFFYGFSAAPLLLPLGLSGPETIQAFYKLHDQNTASIYPLFDQNSVLYHELTQIIDMVGVDFIVNVLIDHQHRFIDIFSGKPTRVIVEIAKNLCSEEFCHVQGQADVVVTCTGSPHSDQSWYHNLMSICLSNTLLSETGTLIYVTSLFDTYDTEQREAIVTKEDIIAQLVRDKVMNVSNEHILSCLNQLSIVFVSPSYTSDTDFNDQREVHFCRHFDRAVQVARKDLQRNPRILLLPDGLYTPICLARP